MGATLIITGMHRSGTSLVSSYFQRCGVDIGEELVAPAFDNPKGYFEDTFFVKMHRKIIADNKTSMFLPEIKRIEDGVRDEISRYVENKKGLWGWKDPRTVMFLDMYQDILPNAEYIFIFRHPYCSINSLKKRGSDPEIVKNCRIAGKSWCWYNNKILQFYKNSRCRSHLFFLEDVLNYPDQFSDYLVKKISKEIVPVPFNEVYEKKALTEKEIYPYSKLTTYPLKRSIDNLFKRLVKEKVKL